MSKRNGGILAFLILAWIAAALFFPRLQQASNIIQPPTIINGVPLSSSLSLSTLPLTQTYTAGAGGTTAGLLVSSDGLGNVITALVSTIDVIGVAMSSVIATASVEVASWGKTTCIADGTITLDHILVVSTLTAGRCADAGNTNPTLVSAATPIVGRALSAATVGNPVSVQLQIGAFGGGTLAGVASTAIQFGGSATGQLSQDVANFKYTGATHLLTTFKQASVTNCSSSASPAVCGSAYAGSVVVAAGATTVVVNTSAVTTNSQIILTSDSSLGTKLSVTCNATEPALYGVTARSNGVSFTITSTSPITNPACFSYFIMN